jgi:mitogen-activated protein kinase kinase kinase 9
LRCREEDLNRAQMKQRMHEEQLRQKEQELQAREIDLLERELHFMIKQQTPTPIKRKGKGRCRIDYGFGVFPFFQGNLKGLG